jgi:hypothetical protein
MKSKTLDQYYTRSDVAKNILLQLYKTYDKNLYKWIEPSAGEGAFFNLLPEGSIGIDIDAKMSNIIDSDFLEWRPSIYGKPFFVIGNPPFGKNSSLAIKFFNHAATFADYIGFIVPKTFQKLSVQNRLSLDFSLVKEISMPKNSFIFNNETYDVPTVFQLWSKTDTKRDKIKIELSHKDFMFVNKDYADFSFQRVGVNAGKISSDFMNKSPNSHYFIKSINKDVINVLLDINWDNIKEKTAGNPSISKTELIKEYNKITN